nr:cytochrome P450 [Paris polyphylla]
MELQYGLDWFSGILVLLGLYCIGWSWMGKSKKQYPPIAGSIFHQFLNLPRLHDYHTKLSHKYRTFRLYAPFRHHIYTVDPTNIEHILQTNFNNYGKGQYNYVNTAELFGDGIFAVDGEKWRHQRKLASYEFSTKVWRDFSATVFKTTASKLAQIISAAASSNQTIDIQDLFMKSTMDSIFKVGFGTELDCLGGSDEGSKFAKAFDTSSELITRRYVHAFWKIERFLKFGPEAELRKNIKDINDFVYKLISTKTEQIPIERSDSGKKEDILSRFLVEMDKDPENMTHKYLRDIVLNFLIAGKDTTAGTLAWFIYMLCKHPSVQEKVAKEVKESIESNEGITTNDFSKCITDEALNKMQYLHAALSETLRLYPAVPLDNKVCLADDTLPDGSNVRKGDIVFYQPYAMGRMEFLWGPDAEIFRPERWIDDQGFFHPESPFKFTTFQAGPRICLGKEFAYRQMKIFAAILLRFFVFKLADETADINYRTMITLHIDQGLHIHAFHR